MDMDTARFRVLLAEDDPVSVVFLRDAACACGAAVTDCADGQAALALARSENWALLILDHHLPGLNSDVVLTALRADPGSASHATPAIATSAAPDIETAALLRAGFIEVLPKPMDLETLRAALRRHGCPPELPLDDDDALRACGSPQAVTRLRRLFAEQELPKVQDELDRLAGEPAALRPTLHRLRASCGFCGARALAEANAALHRALAAGGDGDQVRTMLEAFRAALAETRAALHASFETGTQSLSRSP